MQIENCMKLGGPTLRGIFLFLALAAAIPVVMQHHPICREVSALRGATQEN